MFDAQWRVLQGLQLLPGKNNNIVSIYGNSF